MATPPHVPQPETELEEFFDLSIDPLSIIGFDGEFERVNASFVRLLGYTKPELFSLSALGILHPDDVEPAREALAQLAQGHDVVRFEARVICADGALRWLEWNTRSMPERGVVYSVGRDTTERRRVEAELREAQHVLEASRDELRVLAEEQAALRRVATLVAQDVPSRDLFGAVAREVGTLFGADFSGMIRYEDDGSLTTVATWAAAGEHPLVPTRWEREPGDPAAMIEAAREATRMDDWTSVPGAMAEVIRNVLGVSSSVGCPIVVEGRLWGALAVHSKQSQPLPPDTESRIAQFTDLVDTAIANAESHARADRLAEEQATLRRLATLVAREAPLEAVFAKVAEEVARTLGDVDSALWRDDGDRTVTAVAVRGPSVAPGVRVGTRLTLDGDSVIALVLREGRPHRIDDFSQIAGSVAERARELGMRSAVGCPIVVGSRTWGAMTVATYEAEAFAPETETRVARFSDLVATAIANAEARAEVERLAAEQAALRRVATLVATEGSPAEVLVKIAEQVANLLGDADCALYRDEGDGTATVVGIAGATLSATVHLGTRWPIDGTGVIATVLLTGRQHRIDDHAEATGTIATVGRDRIGGRTAVGCPIVVGGRIWGAIAAGRYRSEAFPAETETALRRFADLAATAVVNAEARAEVERLAEEQAALRGVATLVARGVPPADVFEAIAREAGRLLGVDAMHMGRYDTDAATSVAAWSRAGGHLRVGTRVELDGTNVASLVLQSGRPERIDGYSEEGGTTAERLRHRMRVYCSVAVPILVDGRMWGLMIASSKEDRPLPADTESRLLGFTALAEMAISNTEARTELAASRARVVAAADEERRRVVRDLHDGAQQRLVHTMVTLQLAQRAFRNEEGNAESLLGQALEQAEQGHRELRELAHGILPAVLTRGGLRAGVAAVVDRLDLPVAIDVPAERLPAEIEASAYFIVAEALTNVVKHSHAGRAEVTASLADGRLRVEVRDNGAGGADPDGHGLLGIRDRVTTLGGRLEIESPAGGGTLVAATLPLSAG